MCEIEFIARQKFLRSPLVVAYDQEGRGARRSSILIPRTVFESNKIPKKLKVTIEWNEESMEEGKKKESE